MEEHDDKLKTLRKQFSNRSLDQAESQCTLTSIAPAIEINYVDNEVTLWHNMRLTESELLANKPLTTLANLCNQCNELTKTAQQLQLSFLNISARIENLQAGQAGATASLETMLHQMSSAIDFFCQVHFLLKRVMLVLQNMWMQISAYVSLISDINEAHLFVSFSNSSFCDILLVQSDCLFAFFRSYSRLWLNYWNNLLASTRSQSNRSFPSSGRSTRSGFKRWPRAAKPMKPVLISK